MRRPSLSLHAVRTRLALWNVGILALVLVVLGTAFRLRMQAVGIAEVDRSLARAAHGLQAQVDRPPPPPRPGPAGSGPGGSGPGGPGPDGPPPFPPPGGPPPPRFNHPQPGEYRPVLLNLSGRALFGLGPPGETPLPYDRAAFAQSAQGREVSTTIQLGLQPVRVLSIPLQRAVQRIGVGQFAASLAPLQQEVDRMTRTLLTLIPLALLIAAVGGLFLTDRALRPVRRITQAAGCIEADDLSGRLPVTGSDEFADLADTFNGMLSRLEKAFDRLERAYEQQRRFTADASHELRTPLTIIKANTSLALLNGGTADDYRHALVAADRAADRTTRLVQDLLLLARSDAGEQSLRREPVSLSLLLTQAAEAVHAPVQRHLPGPELCILGDSDALLRLFTNLLENAARHTPFPGTITLSAERHGESVDVIVADTGEGIAAEHLPHLFERFYRADAARSGGRGGTGLGLAICRSITEAHGGEITLSSEVGVGTTVRVTLPLPEQK